MEQEVLDITETKSLIMQKTSFKEKDYWHLSQQWRSADSDWMWSQKTIMVPIGKGRDLAKALRNFADAIEAS